MEKVILILDVSYLAWRAFHVLGGLQKGVTPTGVTFGLLKDIKFLTSEFSTPHLVFAFDVGDSLRAKVYPGYKASRKNKVYTPEEEKAFRGVRTQIDLLRTKRLTDLGYTNLIYADGYEADDCIASAARTLLNQDKRNRVVIVSADHDLFQCIRKRVSVWLPSSRTMMNLKAFRAEYGIEPQQWPTVKAIAGCKSDDIIGVKGVGEKTACKFLAGPPNPKSKTHQLIQIESPNWIKNMQLVRLPYPGCPTFDFEEDCISTKKWRELCDSLGMKTIRDRPPLANPAKLFRRGSG